MVAGLSGFQEWYCWDWQWTLCSYFWVHFWLFFATTLIIQYRYGFEVNWLFLLINRWILQTPIADEVVLFGHNLLDFEVPKRIALKKVKIQVFAIKIEKFCFFHDFTTRLRCRSLYTQIPSWGSSSSISVRSSTKFNSAKTRCLNSIPWFYRNPKKLCVNFHFR